MSFIHCKAKCFIEKAQIYLSANSLIVIYLQVYNLVNLEQNIGGGTNSSVFYSEEMYTRVSCSCNHWRHDSEIKENTVVRTAKNE
jgi:hypothetical protein